jgi:hypothetical protein
MTTTSLTLYDPNLIHPRDRIVYLYGPNYRFVFTPSGMPDNPLILAVYRNTRRPSLLNVTAEMEAAVLRLARSPTPREMI